VPGVTGGYLGVDVFFVLSGFLITRLLAQEIAARGRIDLGDFYLRRLERLYPALLLMLAAYLLIAPMMFGAGHQHWRDAAIAGTYLADYGQAFSQIPRFLGHTWSLAVEAKFYLLWPLVLMLLWRLPRARRIQAILLLAASAMLWRWYVAIEVDSWVQSYFRFDTRLSGVLIGCAIGAWQPRTPAILGWVGLAAAAAAIHFARWATLPGIMTWPLLAEAGSALLVLTADRIRPLRHPLMAWIGRMSYGIYLWHYPFMYWMRTHGFHWSETLIIGAVAGTACAALSYYTVESAIRSRRRKRASRAKVIVSKEAAGLRQIPGGSARQSLR
jgi:peptidoglycan/LPS O-acetylase OafA/YrhL